jgi:hypothetical protein
MKSCSYREVSNIVQSFAAVRGSSRAEKICTVCEETGEIGDSMKTSSSRMKNKVGAKGGIYKDETRKYVYLSMVGWVVLCSYYRTIKNQIVT